MQNLQRNNDKLKKRLGEYEELMREARDEMRAIPRYGATLVDPANHMAKIPSLAPARGATRHFTRTFTITANAPGDFFGLKLSPLLQDFVSVANRQSSVGVAGLVIYDSASLVYNGDYTTGDILTQSELGKKSNSYEFTSTTSGVSLARFDIRNYSLSTKDYTISYKIGGSWAVQGTIAVKPMTVVGATTVAGTYPVPAGVFSGIRIEAVVEHHYGFVVWDLNASAITADSLNRPIIRDEWIQSGEVERYRISAMSVLASYRGNLLENAGVIAGARAPAGWRGIDDNLYSSICRLPENKYKGPIVEGVYVWWLPMDGDELDFRDPAPVSSSEVTSLYIGGQFGDANGSLEVTVDLIVDFYSPLQIFERKLFPPMTDAYFMLLHDLSQLPASTCNPRHLDILKKGVKTAASGLMKGYDLALKHPEVVNIFLKALAAIAM